MSAVSQAGLWEFLDHRFQHQSSVANPCRGRRAQEWRRVHVSLDAHATPRFVSPGQNKTMRKRKASNIRIGNV
jgi:hypothetical protein